MSRYDNIIQMAGGPVSVLNPERGCGTLRPGKYYLRQKSAEDGILARLTFCWGTHVAGLPNLYATNVAARGVTLFNPAATVLTGEIFNCGIPVGFDDSGKAEEYRRLVGLVGSVGILDHVGEGYYTPWSFIEESWRYGVSRKVAPNLAKSLVKLLPLPIFFCHPLPLFNREGHRNEIMDNYHLAGRTDPVWFHEGWGMTAEDDYSGDDHFMMSFVRSVRDENLATRHEMIFMASWITDVGRVVFDESELESGDVGIIPIVLDMVDHG